MQRERSTTEAERRPAWREPMVWLVAALPAASVAAAIALLVLATRSAGTDDAVADHVQRTAQMQVADLGPDALAQKLKLRALVRSAPGVIDVVPLEGTFDRNAALTLGLHHPSRADLDRTVSLVPTATGWQSDQPLDLSHDWNVQLGTPDGRWRLRGRWSAGQHTALLRPALGAVQ
jgi:hypothetical protein